MIHNHDRKGYFGASDTRYVMAENRDTDSWRDWWDTKLGAPPSFTGNRATVAGEMYEHPILEAVDDGITMDGQILIPDRRIRVNYDGYKDGIIYEVKTHSEKHAFKVTDAYWMQVQVEMLVYQMMSEKWFLPPFKKLYIVSYPLEDADYDLAAQAKATGDTSDLVVNPNKMQKKEVAYDSKFARRYLRRVGRLARKLDKALEGENEACVEQTGESDPDTDQGEKDGV